MTTQQIENPAAFPVPNDANVNNQAGMTLRDYFAAKAISLFSLEKEHIERLQNGGQPNHEVVAHFCYQLADAMLKARVK